MAEELIYTSVPRGLDPQTSGYSTVAKTSGLGGRVQRFLESVSVYSFEKGRTNLVCITYLRQTIGRDLIHVLSRIAPSGNDYSGRAVFLAHHLVLHTGETPAAGPAWLARSSGIFRSSWQGKPREFDREPRIPQGNVNAGVASTWKRLTGDAGWAGVLAAAARDTVVTWIICPPSTPVLDLFHEAIALLPPSERWKPTFATNYQSDSLPSNVPCLWRAVAAGSREAEKAKSRRSDKVIDLTTSPGSAPSDKHGFCETARNGSRAPSRQTQKRATARRSKSETAEPSVSETYRLSPNSRSSRDDSWDDHVAETITTGHRFSRHKSSSEATTSANRPAAAVIEKESGFSSAQLWGAIAGGGLSLAAIIVACFLLFSAKTVERQQTHRESKSVEAPPQIQESIDRIKSILDRVSAAGAAIREWDDTTNNSQKLIALRDELRRSLEETDMAQLAERFAIVKDFAGEERVNQLSKEKRSTIDKAKATLALADSMLSAITLCRKVDDFIKTTDTGAEIDRDEVQSTLLALGELNLEKLPNSLREQVAISRIRLERSSGFFADPKIEEREFSKMDLSMVLDTFDAAEFPKGFDVQLHAPPMRKRRTRSITKRFDALVSGLVCQVPGPKTDAGSLHFEKDEKSGGWRLVLQVAESGRTALPWFVVEIRAPLFRRHYRIRNEAFEHQAIRDGWPVFDRDCVNLIVAGKNVSYCRNGADRSDRGRVYKADLHDLKILHFPQSQGDPFDPGPESRSLPPLLGESQWLSSFNEKFRTAYYTRSDARLEQAFLSGIQSLRLDGDGKLIPDRSPSKVWQEYVKSNLNVLFEKGVDLGLGARFLHDHARYFRRSALRDATKVQSLVSLLDAGATRELQDAVNQSQEMKEEVKRWLERAAGFCNDELVAPNTVPAALKKPEPNDIGSDDPDIGVALSYIQRVRQAYRILCMIPEITKQSDEIEKSFTVYGLKASVKISSLPQSLQRLSISLRSK